MSGRLGRVSGHMIEEGTLKCSGCLRMKDMKHPERAGGGRRGAMCSGTGEREALLKMLPSPKNPEPVQPTREVELRRFLLFLRFDLGFLGQKLLFFEYNRVRSLFHGGDGGASVFTSLKASYSAGRELPDAPPPAPSAPPLSASLSLILWI